MNRRTYDRFERQGEPQIGHPASVWTCVAFAALCTALVYSWQALKVRSEFGGNWTGLFDTGRDFPPPPELSFENIRVVSDTTGYDGQFYHYVAHDPFFRHGLSRYIDSPRLRYGRILVPLAAYVLAAGKPQWIDRAYLAVVSFFVFLGAYWTARYALLHGLRPDSALLFALIPATILSIETLTVDVALIALCVGFYLMQEEPAWKLLPILVLAPLVRETGVLLSAASVLSATLTKRWGRAALFAVALTPWLLWTWFVHLHTPAQPYAISPIPLSETWRALLNAQYEAPGPLRWILDILDRLAILGSVAAIVLALRKPRRWEATGLACIGFALLGLVLQRSDVWLNYHAHTRVFSPLYVWLAMQSKARPSFALLPLAMVMPRFLIRLMVQIPLFL